MAAWFRRIREDAMYQGRVEALVVDAPRVSQAEADALHSWQEERYGCRLVEVPVRDEPGADRQS